MLPHQNIILIYLMKQQKNLKNPKAVSNWLMSDIARILNEKEEEADKIPFTGKELGELVELIDKRYD